MYVVFICDDWRLHVRMIFLGFVYLIWCWKSVRSMVVCAIGVDFC